MNAGSTGRIKHIDPREQRVMTQSEVQEIRALVHDLRAARSTPYRYVRMAFRDLCAGQTRSGLQWMDYAERFTGHFYPANSLEEEQFRADLIMYRFMMLNLAAQFEILPPERD